MNQEFITILHLVDARLAYFREDTVDGKPAPVYIEATLPQITSFLTRLLDPSKVAEVQNAILFQLLNILDYKDQAQAFVEQADYWRAKKQLVSTYADPVTQTRIDVPGVILSASKYVMRTEGVIVESVLGQGDALDAYSHGLQDETIRSKRLANEMEETEVSRNKLRLQSARNNDQETAKLLEELYPAGTTNIYSVWPPEDADTATAPATGNGNG
jgi:hypothetical protein